MYADIQIIFKLVEAYINTIHNYIAKISVAGLIRDPPKPKTFVPHEDSAIEVAKESFTPHAIKMKFRSETNGQKLVTYVNTPNSSHVVVRPSPTVSFPKTQGGANQLM